MAFQQVKGTACELREIFIPRKPKKFHSIFLVMTNPHLFYMSKSESEMYLIVYLYIVYLLVPHQR
jgi:hypothetical protein